MEIKHERITHKGYTEWKNAGGKNAKVPRLFGRYQHIYSYGETIISLVCLHTFERTKSKKIFNYKPFKDAHHWEIYQLSGPTLFEDIERFPTKELAIIRINTYLKSMTTWQKIKSRFTFNFNRGRKAALKK